MEILNSHLAADEDENSDENLLDGNGDKSNGSSKPDRRRTSIFTSDRKTLKANNVLLQKKTGTELKLQHIRTSSNRTMKSASLIVDIEEKSGKSSFGTDSEDDESDND